MPGDWCVLVPLVLMPSGADARWCWCCIPPPTPSSALVVGSVCVRARERVVEYARTHGRMDMALVVVVFVFVFVFVFVVVVVVVVVVVGVVVGVAVAVRASAEPAGWQLLLCAHVN